MNDPIVGIDLGTSNSVVAHADASGGVRVLPDEAGYKIHPSVVSFHPSGGVVVGSAAKQRKVIDPKNTIYSTKRLIGRSFNSTEVAIARERMPYQIVEGANQQPLVVTRGGQFAIPEISAIVLDHVRNAAATQLQTAIERAVVTVPATFNDAQRTATATAGAIAGLSILRVLNEPTAAALAYGNTRNLHEIIAVYDFGGGTFDITVLKLDGDVYEVLGTGGDTFLGGDDLDERLVDRMVEKFLADNRVDLRMNEVSMMRLRAVAEQTKIELSRRSRAIVRVDEVAYGPNGKPLDLQIEIARDEFVRSIADIVARTFPVCQEALAFAELSADRISDVVLVGGTTKIPYVRDQVAQFFNKAPRTDVSAEDAVAMGAALQANAMEHLLGRTSPPRGARNDFSAEEPSETTATRPKPELKSRMPLVATDERTETAASALAYPPRAGEASRQPRLQTERPATPGQHHDRFLTPPPIPAPTTQIGRMARPAVAPATTPVRPITSVPSIPPRPPPPPPTAEPVPRATGPALTMRGHAVGSLPLIADNDDSAITVTGEAYVPLPSQAPTVTGEPQPLPPAPAPIVPLPKGNPVSDISAESSRGGAAASAQRNPVVLEVTPRGLGIATVAGYCEELIRRNSRIPTEIRKLFTTSRDGQDTVRIVICQGESRRLDHNVVLGDLTLADLPAKPRGEMSLEVTFHLDASGILQVRAREAHSGREQRASLDLVGAMPQADIEASRERVQRLRK